MRSCRTSPPATCQHFPPYSLLTLQPLRLVLQLARDVLPPKPGSLLFLPGISFLISSHGSLSLLIQIWARVCSMLPSLSAHVFDSSPSHYIGQLFIVSIPLSNVSDMKAKIWMNSPLHSQLLELPGTHKWLHHCLGSEFSLLLSFPQFYAHPNVLTNKLVKCSVLYSLFYVDFFRRILVILGKPHLCLLMDRAVRVLLTKKYRV